MTLVSSNIRFTRIFEGFLFYATVSEIVAFSNNTALLLVDTALRTRHCSAVCATGGRKQHCSNVSVVLT